MTIFHSNWNMKTRELYCKVCRKYTKNDLTAPVCAECGTHLITVVYSLIDGKRMTDESQLVKGHNQST